MRKTVLTLICALIVTLFAGTAEAQNDFLVTEPTTPMAMGEVTDEPGCFNVINKAPYTVYGSINTNYFIRPDGIKTRHKSNFRLEEGETVNFCSTGPFYDDQKLELVLRSLVPVFTCKTAITGDVTIYGRHKREGGTETYAVCL